MPDEEELCKNGTTFKSQIPQEPESAKTLQRSDKKPLKMSLFKSQQINTVEEKSSLNSGLVSTNNISNDSVVSGKNATSLKSEGRELDQAPKMSQPRYGGHERSFPGTELSQIVLDNVSTEKMRGTIDEQGQNTTNVLQTEVRENSKEGFDLRLRPTDTKQPMIRDQHVQHRPVNPDQASRSLYTDESGTPSGLSDPEGSSSLTKRPDAFYGTDPQTARLHALTSSLAVKTSKRMTSKSPRCEGPRCRKDVESIAVTRINCHHGPSQPATAITPSWNTALASSEMVNAKPAGHELRNLNVHVPSDAVAAQSTQNISPNITEIRFWVRI